MMEGQDRARSEASARYVYAVIPRVATADLGAVGIGGAHVYALAHRAIAAVVHDCPPEPYQGEPETVASWVRDPQRRHRQGLERGRLNPADALQRHHQGGRRALGR